MFKTIFIVNPSAGRGRLKGDWQDIERVIRSRFGQISSEFTRQRGDGVKATRRAVDRGFELVIAVGGDGTINECLNGFFDRDKPVNSKANFGILPYGRGSDLARSLGISRDPRLAIECLSGRRVKLIDVGKLTCQNAQGKTSVRYFLNNAYVGLGTLVDSWSGRSPKFFGSTLAYLYGVIRGALDYRPVTLRYSNSVTEKESTIWNLVVANGPYFGSGMKAAPRAVLDDGLLDIVVIEKMSWLKTIVSFPQMYTGEYVKAREVKYFCTKSIRIFPSRSDEEVPIDMDGDTIGQLPATFEILPQVLRFKV